MLTQITVRNLAIVDSLELEFGKGLTTLTGETGAGKSILVDALGLILGSKADSTLVRHGCQRAEVTAVFDIDDNPMAKQWLMEQDLLEDGEEQCLIRRSIQSSGRSRAFICGSSVTLQNLRTLGEKLIDIHSQHSHQALLNEKNQKQLLDEYAGAGTTNRELNSLFRNWQLKRRELEQLRQQSEQGKQQLELLQYQLAELDSFAPRENEIAELESEYKKLSHASEIISSLSDTLAELTGSESSYDDNHNAQSLLASSCRRLQDLSSYDSRYQGIEEMLNQALVQLEEACHDLRGLLNQTETDPQRLEELEKRISQYHDLARKHQCDASELHNIHRSLQKQRENLADSEIQEDDLQQQIQTLEQQYFQLAKKLSQQRQTAARELARSVTQHLKQLGMEQAVFDILLTRIDNPQQLPLADGLETVSFQVNPNKGQQLQAIAKIASGGELSRIGLAIAVETARFSQVPTLVFDEVDVGVGGKVAQMTGHKLAKVAEQCQVLCITHQAQVAAYGDQHYRVEKNITNGTTISTIQPLSETQRIEELSRMLSGASITDTTRRHAMEMLQQARNKTE